MDWDLILQLGMACISWILTSVLIYQIYGVRNAIRKDTEVSKERIESMRQMIISLNEAKVQHEKYEKILINTDRFK